MKRAFKWLVDRTLIPALRYVALTAFWDTIVAREQAGVRREFEELRARLRERQPDNPASFGLKIYSQADEDGILQNILSRIPGHKQSFVEIGCGNGLENNTHGLALLGYRGCWIDADPGNMAVISNALGGLAFKDLVIQQHMVSLENIAEVLRPLAEFIGTTEIGFFSLDIDGNDLAVMAEAVKHISPQVLCAEYNARFPPPLSLEMRYDANFVWRNDDYHGSSLQAFCDRLDGYRLVACSLSGVNAFFVRNDLLDNFTPYSTTDLYQPLRLNLTGLRPEHRPTLKWLRDRLNAPVPK